MLVRTHELEGAFRPVPSPDGRWVAIVEGYDASRVTVHEAATARVAWRADVEAPASYRPVFTREGRLVLVEGETTANQAHLLEHLVFKGSEKFPEITREIARRGGRANGTTWYDRTNYYETLAATDENLRWALDLEADRMVNSFIAQKDLDNELSEDVEQAIEQSLVAQGYRLLPSDRRRGRDRRAVARLTPERRRQIEAIL